MPDFERIAGGVASASQSYQKYLSVHRRGAKGLNLKDWGRILGWVCMIGSLIFWIPMEWSMAQPISGIADALIAVAFGVYVAVGAPVIVSIFLPGTRAGRLLLSLNIATPGKIVGLGAGGFLIFHAFRLLYYWWLGRVAGQAGMAYEYAILGVVFTIISPALFYEGQSEAELHESLAQEHATQVYEQAAQGRINLMLQARLNAEGLMKKGLENLSTRESEIVARYMRGFTEAVDQRHLEWQKQIKETSGVILPYSPLGADPRVADMFSFLGNLSETTAIDVQATRREIEAHTQQQLDAGRPSDGRLQPLPQPVAAAPTVAPAATAAARSGPSETVPVRSDEQPEGDNWESYCLAYEALVNEQPFIRADIERVLKCKRSKAGTLIADWKTQGWAADVPKLDNHYTFLYAVRRTGGTP